MCDPVKKLPKCRYFRDVTWTLVSGAGSAGNATEQVVHCHCPRGSVAYLVKRQAFTEAGDAPQHLDAAPLAAPRFKYSFACSPQSVSIPFFRFDVPGQQRPICAAIPVQIGLSCQNTVLTDD